MKNIRLKVICLIVIVCFLSIGIIACQKNINDQNLTSRQKSVLNAANKFKKFYNEHNKSEMKKMISEDAELLIGTGKNKKYVSKLEYISMFPKRWEKYPKFKNTFYKIKMLDNNKSKLKTYIMINSKRINIDWNFKKDEEGWLLTGYDY